MIRRETQELLMIIQAAYPNYRPQDKTVTVNLWQTMLSGYDYHGITAALQTFIAEDTSGFPPSIGQIIQIYQSLARPGRLGSMEAWNLVAKALRNGIYGYKEEFQRLPPEVREAVGEAENLHFWAMDESFNEEVVMSQFVRAYTAACNRADRETSLPNEARAYREALNPAADHAIEAISDHETL